MEKQSFSLKLLSGDFYGQSFIKTVRGPLCYLCPVFVMRSRVFIAALWSPEGKGLTSLLLFVMFNVILLHSNSIPWDRCGT